MTVCIARHMGHHKQGDEEGYGREGCRCLPLDLGLATVKTAVFTQLDEIVREARGELWQPTAEAAR